ncbi:MULTISPECIES: Hsp70 family protein [unclassified Rhodococcus (in: high G+C Gram-positive bacteria)]|uniref:Hsp70 family protein n=1 Tax=unclassified Rhodococcus (in: high G+C Gram-positive bacteria) TaxID=192944 RepID=UPI00163B4CAF|nr:MULTISPECIES: Hsp70 family protein [unclassified Rhodococcus (in: high G+C Gram-positive bacteria)]MBC2642735.1 Hsp70 family protein [Rhodococcus sp. 3A]MBC2892523.1 Hsp70 family protein [Rhodococcus sp. 4CII]
MSSVLGVSVGASAVRLARPDSVNRDGTGSRHLPDFLAQVVAAGPDRPEELAAESIGVVLAGTPGAGQVHATGVAYRDEAQAGAVQAAMARQQLVDYQLVTEASAALAFLDASGALADHRTLVFYDLGSSGLTVSVVDRATGDVVETTRTDTVSGDVFDGLIRDNQLENKRIDAPGDAAESLALDCRCREAKERLSTGGAVAVPGDGGLLLLSRDVFDGLIGVTVESSARLARDVIERSGRVPDAMVLVGGGARIPLVRSVLESWLGLPVIVPDHPELVAAQGAALLAQQVVPPVPVATVLPPHHTPAPVFEAGPSRRAPTAAVARSGAPSSIPSWLSAAAPPPSQQVAKLQIRGAALAGSALAVIAVIGLGLGYGGTLLGRTEGTSQPVTTQLVTEPPTVTEMATPSPTPLPPPPTSEAVEAPVQTASQIRIPDPVPAPPPPPAPLFPGLPQIQLPPLQLPELPRFPGT